METLPTREQLAALREAEGRALQRALELRKAGAHSAEIYAAMRRAEDISAAANQLQRRLASAGERTELAAEPLRDGNVER